MTSLIISTDAPAVAGPPQGHWTYADWETLPDDGNRYEIIDPRAHPQPLPARHARALYDTARLFGN